MRRLIVFMVVWAVSWLWPTAVVAAHKVTLDIRPTTGGEVPTHVCVVSESKGPRTREALWDVLEGHSDDVAGRAIWRMKPEAWGGDATGLERQHCSDSPNGDCRPRVELPATMTRDTELYVACTADTLLIEQRVTKDPRVLVILLEHLGGSPPPIESIRFAGGIATVGVGTRTENVVVTARSLGGHYAADSRVRLEEETGGAHKLVVMQVTPRCRWVDVVLPGTRFSERDRARLDITVHGSSLAADRCVGPLRGTEVVPVRIPHAQGIGIGTIDIRERPEVAGGPESRFGGSWPAEWPPDPFPLQATQLFFHWERPACIYPADECPVATLPETGTTCEAISKPAGCEYRCPAAGETGNLAALDLPVKVRFEKGDPRQSWEDTVARNGQILTGYVPADEIYLMANLKGWDTRQPGSRVEEVTIYAKDGTHRDYAIASAETVEKAKLLAVKVPYASCDLVRYRPTGDRKHDHGLARVADGQVYLPPANNTARILTFNVMIGLGGGPAWDLSGGALAPEERRIFFSAIGQIAARFRPRKAKYARLTPEVRVVGTIGEFGFEEELLDPNIADPVEFKKLGWARTLIEPGLVVDATHRVAFGVGAGIGVSFPIRRTTDLTTDLLTFVTAPNLDVRFKVTNRFAFVIQLRTFIEQAATRTITMDSTGATTTEISRRAAATLLTVAAGEVSF